MINIIEIVLVELIDTLFSGYSEKKLDFPIT